MARAASTISVAWQPTYDEPRRYAPDGTIEEGTENYLEAYADTPAEREVRQLREVVTTLFATGSPRPLGAQRELPTDLLTLRETGQSVRVLRAAITSGELPGVKVGREFQVRRGDLNAWLTSKSVAPRERAALELSPADRAIAAAQRKGALRVA